MACFSINLVTKIAGVSLKAYDLESVIFLADLKNCMTCEEKALDDTFVLYEEGETRGLLNDFLEKTSTHQWDGWHKVLVDAGKVCCGFSYSFGGGRCVLIFKDSEDAVEKVDLERLSDVIEEIGTILASLTPGSETEIFECEDQNKKLLELNQKLLNRNQNKDSFIAHLSHELRTPISGILLTAESLETGIYGELNPKQLNAVKNIENSCNYLISMINELLDIAKLADGKVELNQEVALVNEICEDALRTTHDMFEQKNQNLRVEYSSRKIFAVCDARRLKQVIINLLSNASKFTENNGNIEVILGLDKKGSSEEELILEVKDNGKGISETNKLSLFEPFTQFHNDFRENGRRENGSGLGLSIVKALVELHEGKIQVFSEVNSGSCFRVVLPTKMKSTKSQKMTAVNQNITASENQAENENSSGNQKLILIVEDNEVNIIGVSEFLKANNFRIITAGNGEEGVRKVIENRPDLVLMDVQMPKMDGIEATKIIRGHEEPYFQKLPILMYTALGMPGDEERCLETGADEYFMKPFGLKNLVNKIKGYLY